jgi:hypothetical protein
VPAWLSHSALDRDGDIEEGTDTDRLGRLHPVYIGNIYPKRYQVSNKIGVQASIPRFGWRGTFRHSKFTRYCGSSKLTRQTKNDILDDHDFLDLRFSRAECYGAEPDIFEGEILIEHAAY